MTAESIPNFPDSEKPQSDFPTPGTLSYLFGQDDWRECNEREQARIDEISYRCAREAISMYWQDENERNARWWQAFGEGDVDKLR